MIMNKRLICFSLIFLFPLTSSCSLEKIKSLSNNEHIQKLGPTLMIELDQEHLYPVQQETDSSYFDKEPQIIIEPITPVICTNETDGKFIGSQCALSETQPFPEKIVFRYGVWITKEEENRLFPPLSEEILENSPESGSYSSDEEWHKADKAYFAKIYNMPKYKSIEEARLKSKNTIKWHNFTIYPRQIMQKYENMSLKNAIRPSILYYDITFKYDNSVNIKEHLQYLDEIEPKQ